MPASERSLHTVRASCASFVVCHVARATILRPLTSTAVGIAIGSPSQECPRATNPWSRNPAIVGSYAPGKITSPQRSSAVPTVETTATQLPLGGVGGEGLEVHAGEGRDGRGRAPPRRGRRRDA